MSTVRWLPTTLAFAVSALVALSGSTLALSSATSFGGSSTGTIGIAVGHSAPVHVAGSPPTGTDAAAVPHDESPPICQTYLQHFYATHPKALPKDVRRDLQDPCYIGHDEPTLNFVSNSSYSGSRTQFGVDLPKAGTFLSGAMWTFWIGMWLSGVPCSLNGQSFLEIQLNPPDNADNLTQNPNWTVVAPVWDLVPAGSCDPQCQNDTAFSTIQGVPYCEDDAALSGVGNYTSTGWGNFAPGDSLTVSMVGQVGGSQGLTVYLNDSTHPSSSISWTYSASVSTSGIALEPYYNATGFNASGWGYGLNVAISWENCPEPAAYPTPTPCNSYDGPFLNATGVPTFTGIDSWNASTKSYSNPYPWVATASSAGGCSGSSAVAPCEDFTNYGGTGSYPHWSEHASSGRSWWTYGGTYPNEVNAFGGPSKEFAPNGTPNVYLDSTTVSGLTNSTATGSLALTARVSDPSGVEAAELGVYWCFGSSTVSFSSTALSLHAGSDNTSFDGNWTGSVGLTTSTYSGTVHYFVRAESMGGIWSSPINEWQNVFGGATTCALASPATPGFTSGSVQPISDGYQVNWTETTPGIAGFDLSFTKSTGGSAVHVRVGDVTSARVPSLNESQAYSITVTASSLDGTNSPPTASVAAGPTRMPIVANLSGGTGAPYWIGAASVNFTASVLGGVGGYTFFFSFGDGKNATASSGSPTASITHDYQSYFGVAWATVTVVDARGDLSPPSNADAIQVFAVPLAVPQTVSAGDGFVQVAWSPPFPSPGGPVTHYTVYYSETAAYAFSLTSIWPFNLTAYDLHLHNTSGTSLTLSVPDGSKLYAQVVAWNSHGEGFLPPTPAGSFQAPYLTGVPAPLVAMPISTNPGGVAPFVDHLSTEVTGGTNDTIASATYSFTAGPAVIPTINGSNGTYWLNASVTFNVAGLEVVALHAFDVFDDAAIVTADVYVGAGGVPTINVSVTSPLPAWAGSPVTLAASATGGSGNYTFSWALGDGTNATGANVTHAYATGGNYTVLLRVTDNLTDGIAVRTLSLGVESTPTVAIQASAGPDGAGSYRFTAILSGGSGPLSVVWGFGDGTTGAGSTTTHDFVSSGSYTVNVTAHDPTGRSASSSVTLSVSGIGPAPSGQTALGSDGAPILALVGILALSLLIVGYLIGLRRGRGGVE